MAIRAVIFDMDGVLLDSEAVHHGAYCRALAPYGVDVPLEWFRRNSPGVARREVLQKFASDFQVAIDVDEAARAKGDAVSEILKTLPARVPAGVHETLTALGDEFAIAVATSSTMAHAFLAWAGLSDYFEVVVTSADVARGKPAPDIYLEAARRLGVSAGESVVVEDSEVGVQGAVEAGATVIGYSIVGRLGPLGGADLLAHTFPSILELSRDR